MFGTYRTLLAVMVVLLHLGDVPVIGAYAVFGFYILSGYLMTLITHKNYGYTKSGMARYALNRFLRIYPIYWVSCLLTLLLILWLGEPAVRSYNHSMFLPDDFVSSVKNILLLFPFRYDPRLTPPAWALTVELFYYICIGLGLSRTGRLALLWLAASVFYTVVVNAMGLAWDHRYFTIPAASLPFATGAVIYHYRDRLADSINNVFGGRYAPFVLFGLIIANWLAGYTLGTLRSVNFYSNYLLCAVIVVSLSYKRELPLISRRFDKFMGDLSYPIYLVHYQVGLTVLVFFSWAGRDLSSPGIGFALFALPFIFLAAWLMSRLIELPIERIRERVKTAGISGEIIRQKNSS